jgi:MFS family permease
VTFVTLQPLSTIIGRRIGVKYWISIMMLSWGAICMGHAGIKNRGTLIALRLLLGAAEAGFVPSVFVSLNILFERVNIEGSADQSRSSTSQLGTRNITLRFDLACLLECTQLLVLSQD